MEVLAELWVEKASICVYYSEGEFLLSQQWKVSNVINLLQVAGQWCLIRRPVLVSAVGR